MQHLGRRVLVAWLGIWFAVASFLVGSTTTQAGALTPTFAFPVSGQTFPFAGPYGFQVQSISGAQGYLWTFLQDNTVVWQNLNDAGSLSSASYTIKPNSAAQSRMHPGTLTVRVRALLAKGGWTKATSVSVQLVGAGQGATLPCTVWSLPEDFAVAPHQANPAPDQCGAQGVWDFRAETAGDPLVPKLSTFVPDAFGIAGLEQWQLPADGTNGLPAVGINATGAMVDVPGTRIAWPAGALRVHPSATEAVLIRWFSPIVGNVTISFSLADMDPSCGTGITWAWAIAGSIYQAYLPVDMSNGDAVNFRAAANLTVKKGDSVSLIIAAKNGDPSCDSTDLSIRIAQLGTAS